MQFPASFTKEKKKPVSFLIRRETERVLLIDGGRTLMGAASTPAPLRHGWGDCTHSPALEPHENATLLKAWKIY